LHYVADFAYRVAQKKTIGCVLKSAHPNQGSLRAVKQALSKLGEIGVTRSTFCSLVAVQLPNCNFGKRVGNCRCRACGSHVFKCMWLPCVQMHCQLNQRKQCHLSCRDRILLLPVSEPSTEHRSPALQKRRSQHATDIKELAIQAPAGLRQFSQKRVHTGRHLGESICPDMATRIRVSHLPGLQELNAGQKPVRYRSWNDVERAEHVFRITLDTGGVGFWSHAAKCSLAVCFRIHWSLWSTAPNDECLLMHMLQSEPLMAIIRTTNGYNQNH
jgi:hypothetical protein